MTLHFEAIEKEEKINELIENINSVEGFTETEDVSLENYSSEFESDFSTFDSSDTSDSDYVV